VKIGFRRFLWVIIICSLIVDVASLTLTHSKRSDDKSEPKVLQTPADGLTLSADSFEHDFGTVSQMSTLEHIFKLTNTGDQPLEILAVEKNCGCTSTLLSEKVLEPGESGELKVEFESGSMEGPFRKKVNIFSNAPESETQLVIKGTVQPFYTVDPAMITFGKVRVGEVYRRSVVIQARQDKTPLEFGPIQSKDPQIKIENIQIHETAKRASFDVVFIPQEGGLGQGSISYQTGHPDKPTGYLRFSGRFAP
jgi:uncharacterized protein DUF1573